MITGCTTALVAAIRVCSTAICFALSSSSLSMWSITARSDLRATLSASSCARGPKITAAIIARIAPPAAMAPKGISRSLGEQPERQHQYHRDHHDGDQRVLLGDLDQRAPKLLHDPIAACSAALKSS